jgi:hypothetical protein
MCRNVLSTSQYPTSVVSGPPQNQSDTMQQNVSLWATGSCCCCLVEGHCQCVCGLLRQLSSPQLARTVMACGAEMQKKPIKGLETQKPWIEYVLDLLWFIMIYYDLFHFNLFPPFSAKWSQISQFEKLSVRFPQALITDKYRNEFDYTSCRLNCGTSKRMQKVWCATHDCSTLHVFDKYTNCTNPLCSSHPVAELLHASWSGDEKGFPASGRFPPSLCANYLQLTTEGGI